MNNALVALERAEQSRSAAERELDTALRKEALAIAVARDASHSWAEIGELLKITESQAKWRLQRHIGFLQSDGQHNRAGRGPGVGVSEAARRLNVTRRTVYMWVESGELDHTFNDLGRLRVLLADE